VEDWPAFKEYLLDTDREVVEEDEEAAFHK
jgi:hypothetical protein